MDQSNFVVFNPHQPSLSTQHYSLIQNRNPPSKTNQLLLSSISTNLPTQLHQTHFILTENITPIRYFFHPFLQIQQIQRLVFLEQIWAKFQIGILEANLVAFNTPVGQLYTLIHLLIDLASKY